jgi:hypothetical protein
MSCHAVHVSCIRELNLTAKDNVQDGVTCLLKAGIIQSEESAVTRLRYNQRLAVTSNRSDSCHPVEGGAKFLRHVGSYRSHMA